jgi:hypothetical protein
MMKAALSRDMLFLVMFFVLLPHVLQADGNATLRELPPEVEALFENVKGSPGRYSKNFKESYSKHRFKSLEIKNCMNDVCKDFVTDYELHKGDYQLRCAFSPIHPDHPNKKHFRLPNWQKVDPIQYVGVLFDFYALKAKKHRLNQDYYWNHDAPLIKYALEHGTILRMEKAEMDIDHDKKNETIFRFSYDRHYDGRNDYGHRCLYWMMMMYNEGDQCEKFNIYFANNSAIIFYYKDEIYFMRPTRIGKNYISNNSTEYCKRFFPEFVADIMRYY